jgi:hypothetical protein
MGTTKSPKLRARGAASLLSGFSCTSPVMYAIRIFMYHSRHQFVPIELCSHNVYHVFVTVPGSCSLCSQSNLSNKRLGRNVYIYIYMYIYTPINTYIYIYMYTYMSAMLPVLETTRTHVATTADDEGIGLRVVRMLGLVIKVGVSSKSVPVPQPLCSLGPNTVFSVWC